MLRVRALLEHMRGSLFYVPAFYVVAAGLLSWIVLRVDTAVVDGQDTVPLLLGVTVDSARAILGTIAGATITVAGIVFSVTVVSVQLASSQFSPRVLRGFLRDRFQQSVIGIVVGTFTYCLFVLATTRVSGPQPDQAPAPSLSVTVAIILAVVSMLAIIAFIDHSARAMQVGQIIKRVTKETQAAAERLYPMVGEGSKHSDPGSPPPYDAARHVVRAWADGWVQQLIPSKLMSATPPNAYLRLDTHVGAFVTKSTPLLTIWPDEAPDHEAIKEAIAFGDGRTMQQDVGFGIRQLADIGLRALSPGINDPTTAVEVIRHLGAVLADLIQRDLPSRILTDDDGRVLAQPHQRSIDDFINESFDEIRLAAATQPTVLICLLQTLSEIDGLVVDLALPGPRDALHRQAALMVAANGQAQYPSADRDEVRAAARAMGFVPDA